MKKTFAVIGLLMLFIIQAASQAASYDEANWYITVDVNQVRSTILPILPNNKVTDIEAKIAKHLPQGVEQISFYGHSEQEGDLSLVVNGEFSSFELSEYINSLLYLVEDEDEVDVVLFDSFTHNSRTIEEYRVSGRDESKAFYSAKVNDATIVLSLDESEVKHWVDNKYDTNELKNSGLVSVLVNIESAMAHMGADLASNSRSFNSAIFQKINQFSASIFETGDNLNIEAALSTADEKTAKQLEQVINGLVAMNALSTIDHGSELVTGVLEALEISNQGNDLLIRTEFSLSLIKEMKMAAQKDGFEVKQINHN